MKIEGSADIPAARDKVWAAFLDPNVLAQALPGCEKLEAGATKTTLEEAGKKHWPCPVCKPPVRQRSKQ